MKPYDRQGNPISSYPDTIDQGELLGVNNDGYAVYLFSRNNIVLGLYDDSELQIPPPEFGLVHELPLDVYGWDVGDYIQQSVDLDGKWRYLTARATRALDANPDTRNSNREWID